MITAGQVDSGAGVCLLRVTSVCLVLVAKALSWNPLKSGKGCFCLASHPVFWLSSAHVDRSRLSLCLKRRQLCGC